MDLASVPEISPERFDVTDVAGFKAHLTEHGYAVVKEAVTPEELEHARNLLWSHFEGTEPGLDRMRQAKPTGWQRGEPTTWTQGVDGDGVVQTYGEGIVGGFAAAYGGDPELLAAYDRMMINLPTSTGNEHTLRTAATSFQHGKLNAAGLHTHYNQDGYGDSELICYAICPLWDMNRETGATAIVPGSHLKVAEITASRERRWVGEGEDRKYIGQGKGPEEDLAIVNGTAGDLILFDTALYHAGCPAEDPSGAGPRSHGVDNVLRAICVLSMAPSRLVQDLKANDGSSLFAARRRAYEMDTFIGGTVGKLYFEGPGCISPNFMQDTEGKAKVRDFKDAPPEIRRLVDPTWSAEDEDAEEQQAGEANAQAQNAKL